MNIRSIGCYFRSFNNEIYPYVISVVLVFSLWFCIHGLGSWMINKNMNLQFSMLHATLTVCFSALLYKIKRIKENKKFALILLFRHPSASRLKRSHFSRF